MNPQDVLDDYLVPAAQALGICTLPHLQIGFGTIGQESGFQNIAQVGGPALGFGQCEPATHNSLWLNFILYRPAIKAALIQILNGAPLPPDPQNLLTNPLYGVAMLFVKYLDCPGAIPADLNSQAAYYKLNYNTPEGAATEAEYIANYQHYSAGVVFPNLGD